MPIEQTKYLLKVFGYVYDWQTMMYVPVVNAKEIEEKIQGSQVYDIDWTVNPINKLQGHFFSTLQLV